MSRPGNRPRKRVQGATQAGPGTCFGSGFLAAAPEVNSPGAGSPRAAVSDAVSPEATFPDGDRRQRLRKRGCVTPPCRRLHRARRLHHAWRARVADVLPCERPTPRPVSGAGACAFPSGREPACLRRNRQGRAAAPPASPWRRTPDRLPPGRARGPAGRRPAAQARHPARRRVARTATAGHPRE
jgi:hypothetical protein